MTQLPDHNQPRFGDFGNQPPVKTVVPTRLSILAIFSLITGILALPICCVPAGGTLFGLVPIVLGLGSLRAIRNSHGETAGKSLAIGGLVMGLFAAIVSTLAWTAIGTTFSKMPTVYAQVLDEDPAVVRTVLTTSAASTLTDEEIARFHDLFLADYIQVGTAGPNPPRGIAPMLQSYLKAGEPDGLLHIQPGPMQSVVPIPLEIDQGWTYLYVLIQQGENLGAGLPALANAAYLLPDGSVVWLLENQSGSQSPQPDTADELSSTPPSDPPGADPED